MKTKAIDEAQGLVTKKNRIFGFIANHPTGILATVDPRGNPHASVLYYTADEDGNILIITKQQTQKHENLSHNKHVMLLVYDPEAQEVLQISGVAQEVEDPFDSQIDFAAVLSSSMQLGGYPFSPVSKIVAGAYVVYKVKPVLLRLTTYGYPIKESIVLEAPEI